MAKQLSKAAKALNYYKSVLLQRAARPGDWRHRPCPIPKYVPARVRLDRRITGDFPIGHKTQAGPGDFACECNRYGAVSIVADNGEKLGLRIQEFEAIEWIENPHWQVTQPLSEDNNVAHGR